MYFSLPSNYRTPEIKTSFDPFNWRRPLLNTYFILRIYICTYLHPFTSFPIRNAIQVRISSIIYLCCVMCGAATWSARCGNVAERYFATRLEVIGRDQLYFSSVWVFTIAGVRVAMLCVLGLDCVFCTCRIVRGLVGSRYFVRGRLMFMLVRPSSWKRQWGIITINTRIKKFK